jgi:hypothetical protein
VSFANMLVRTNAVFRVVGVSFYKDAVSQLVRGQRLWLILDDENEHDANAIRVETENAKTIGHVPADLARRLRQGSSERSYAAEVSELRTYEGQTVGADIRLVAVHDPN